jgi:hypothetical protein
MTGGAGTRPAAIGIDAGNHVLDRRFHDRHARRGFDLVTFAVVLDESDLCH